MRFSAGGDLHCFIHLSRRDGRFGQFGTVVIATRCFKKQKSFGSFVTVRGLFYRARVNTFSVDAQSVRKGFDGRQKSFL